MGQTTAKQPERASRTTPTATNIPHPVAPASSNTTTTAITTTPNPRTMLNDTTSQTYAAIIGIFLLAMSSLLIHPTRLIRWAQKKKYQYEVTFALYMLTPTERFIFSALLPLHLHTSFQPTALS